jgi:hypothetical protein
MQFREARHRQVFKAGDLPQICHQNWPLRKLCTAKFILAQNFFSAAIKQLRRYDLRECPYA